MNEPMPIGPIEPAKVTVSLVGDDGELQAIGAIVQIIERVYYEPKMRPLDPVQKDRIARYLFDRYTIQQTRSE